MSLAARRGADALQRIRRALREFHNEARGAQFSAELLTEQIGDIGLVVDD